MTNASSHPEQRPNLADVLQSRVHFRWVRSVEIRDGSMPDQLEIQLDPLAETERAEVLRRFTVNTLT